MFQAVENATKSLVIWRLIDEKPGHQNQSLGLVNAIKRRTDCEVFDIKISHPLEASFSILTSNWHFGHGLPSPDLLIGAGHDTHLHLLAAKKIYGGKTIVLMKPSLPVSMFDLCLIPLHDDYQGWGNFIETRGVLNSIVKSNHARNQNSALILIGGPSKHFEWNHDSVMRQIDDLLKLNPDTHYTLTTSRRTPAGFLESLRRVNLPSLEIVPFETTDSAWVARQLNRVSNAWITEDSVSMVYEGLTANVGVGLINLRAKSENRVSKGVKALVNRGYVTKFDGHSDCQSKLKPVLHFSEADRCSDLILKSVLQPQTTKKPALSFNL